MTYQAGSAAVSIVPDFKDFHSQIAEELTGLDTQFAEAGDKSGKSFADSFQAQLKGSFAELPNATVKADADTTALDAELDEATRDRTAPVKADADTTAAKAQLDALTKPRTVRVKAVADKISGKTGTLADLLNPVAGGIAAGVTLGPSALGLGAGLLGIGAGFAAAAADAGAFGVIAKGMFSDVSAAQKALTAAQEAYNKATTDAGRAKALADEQKALAGLTPAERQLATELTALSSAWKQLQQAEQPVVGQAIAPWLQAAIPGMQLLKPLITDGAGAVALLGSEAKTALADPFWGQFFNTLGVTGQIALTDFGNAAGHVGDGLAHLFVTFAPDIAQVLPLVDKAATAFDKWATSVSDKGLNDFFSKTFSPANVKQLASDGKSLADLVTNIAKASQDMSPLAFGGISNVLTVLGSLPPGVIEAATGLFLAIKTIGTIGQVASGVSGFISKVTGLFGGTSAAAAGAEAEGGAAGTAGGTAAATAFTSSFSSEVTAALPAVFTGIGTTGSTESATAGTAMGTAAATAFGTAFATEDALGVTAALTAVGTESAAEAGLAGAATGTAFAGGFGESLAAIGTAVAAALPEAGGLAALGAALAGGALGLAVGTGFVGGLALSGAKNAASGLAGDVKAAASGAGTWLQPAAQQAAQGFISAWDAEHGAVTAAVGQLKGWTQAGGAGSNTWITPHGQQAGQGFANGFTSAHSAVNSAASQIKGWVTASLPSPLSWLVNIGVSVTQGFLNGLISGAQAIYNEAANIANTVKSTISSALGINSPAKEMIPVGSAVPEGMAVGMIGGAGFITSAGSHLADVTAASLGNLATGQALAALGAPVLAAPARLPGVGSPLAGGQLQLVVTPGVSDGPVMSAIVNGLQFHVQGTTGGDVQAALGLGPVR